jgi:iron complex transport system substrate-binding protein
MSWEDLSRCDPDIIIAMPCGYDIQKTRQEMLPLYKRGEWHRLKPVQSGQVYLTDGNQFFNRPGPRLVESLEILAEIIRPSAFLFGHHGSGWQKAVLSVL